MSKVVSIKKATEHPSAAWTLYRTCSSWDEADAYRVSIIRDAGYSARIRFEGGAHILEWKR